MNILAQDEPAAEVIEVSFINPSPDSVPLQQSPTLIVICGIAVFCVLAACVLFMRGVQRQKPADELHKERGVK